MDTDDFNYRFATETIKHNLNITEMCISDLYVSNAR
jgi:hypothetical protein